MRRSTSRALVLSCALLGVVAGWLSCREPEAPLPPAPRVRAPSAKPLATPSPLASASDTPAEVSALATRATAAIAPVRTADADAADRAYPRPRRPAPEVALSCVSGRVVDTSGAAVARATVRLATSVERGEDDDRIHASVPLGTTETGADGRFVFDPGAFAGFGLTVTALVRTDESRARGSASLAPKDLEGRTSADLGDVVVRTKREGFAELHVRVHSGGQPVPGALVGLSFEYLDSGMSDFGFCSVETDAHGQADIDLCAAGIAIGIEKPGFASEKRHLEVVEKDDVDLDVELSPASPVHGLVLDPAGAPVANLLVEARPLTAPDPDDRALSTAWTDQLGRFELTALAPGRTYAIAAGGFDPRDPGQRPFQALAREVTPPCPEDVEIRFERTGTVVVRLLRDDGSPNDIALALLERRDGLTGEWRKLEAGGCGTGVTYTKELRAEVVPGCYRALCTGEHAEPSYSGEVVVRAGEVAETAARWRPSRVVKGTVTAATGARPIGIRVSAEVGPWTLGEWATTAFVEDEDGTFTLCEVPRSAFRVCVSAQGFEPRVVDVPAGADLTELTRITLTRAGAR